MELGLNHSPLRVIAITRVPSKDNVLLIMSSKVCYQLLP